MFGTGESPPASAPTSGVHCFRLHEHTRQSLLPALRAAADAQRRRDPVGMHVSNVGGWHSHEQAFEEEGDPAAAAEGLGHWYAELLPIVRAAIGRLDEGMGGAAEPLLADGDAAEAARMVSGWLNMSGPAAFNALHDHGHEVQWSLVLFVSTGDDPADAAPADAAPADAAPADALGGSLLLKTQLGPAALRRHGCFPVAPTPGELWAFPGYTPHCAMPRELGPPAARPDGAAQQRVSVAINVYSAASTGALHFVERHMPAVLEARSRAVRAMEALHRGVAVADA